MIRADHIDYLSSSQMMPEYIIKVIRNSKYEARDARIS